MNLTEVAKAFPEKNLSTIVNSQEVKDYINRLSEIKNFSSLDLLQVIKGNYSDGRQQGTWAHQKVALRVCQKLSTDFSIMVDTKIEELLSHSYLQRGVAIFLFTFLVHIKNDLYVCCA